MVKHLRRSAIGVFSCSKITSHVIAQQPPVDLFNELVTGEQAKLAGDLTGHS